MVEPTNGNEAGYEALPGSVPMPSAELRALEAEAAVLLSRLQFMRQAGVSFKGLRDLYEVLGYDREITTEQYRERYDRGGIAGTIVDVMVDATWRGGMWLEEDEDPEKDTPFESAWLELEERLNLSTYMIRADRLSRLSDYAVLLIGTSLDGDLTAELPKGKPENLIYLQPYLGAGGPTRDGRQLQTQSMAARAKVQTYDKDTKSPRYGQPATYSLRLDEGQWVGNVHWSRLVHVAEGCLEDDTFGRSVLKRVWNLLDDLDKVTGGGSEAFFLRANQGMHIDIDKDMSLPDAKNTIDALKEQAEAYKHQLTRWIRTKGTTVTPLGSEVANFAGPSDAVLKQIAGTTRIPTRILTGSEMGELASSQDRENFKDQVNGRQTQQTGPNLVRPVVDRFIAYGYLPTPAKGSRKYKVKWAHIQTLTEQEKVDGAKGWSTVNQTQGEIVFTDAEIREKWADKAPLTDEQRQEIADRKADAVKQAQEAMAATAQPADPNAPPAADKRPNPFMKAAEDAELLRVLEAAIVTGNQDVVNRIIGLQDGPHSYGTTQVQLPDDVAAKLAAIPIDDADLYLPEGGRETDSHVTLRYGLLEHDPAKLADLVANHGTVSFTLGKTSMFAAPDYDVVFVEVNGPDLADLRADIELGMDCRPDDHGAYRPHATVAYVKPGTGPKYTGLDALDGVEVTANSIVMSDAEGGRTGVSLLDQPLKALGDSPGHEFHGNQYTAGSGAVGGRKGENFVKKAQDPASFGSLSKNIKDNDEANLLYEQSHAALESQGYAVDNPTMLSFRYQREQTFTHPEKGTAKLRKDFFAADPRARADGYKGSSRLTLKFIKPAHGNTSA